MQERQIAIDDEAIDLIAGMVAMDPKERFTVQDIAAHNWCQGDCADEDDMMADFEGLEDEKMKEMIQMQEHRQKAIRSAGGGACRKMGGEEEELRPNQDEKEEIAELVEDMKNCDKLIQGKGAKRPFGAFYTHKNPAVILEHLWGYLASQGIDCEINATEKCIDFAIQKGDLNATETKIQAKIVEVLYD